MATAVRTAAKKKGTLDESKDFVKILYYGDAKTGKTTHLAQLARLGPVIYVDAEAGIKRGAMLKREVPIANISPFRDITFDALEKLFWDTKALIEDNPDAIAGVVIDSLTEVQKKLMDVIVVDSVARTRKKGMERSKFDIYKEDWGVNTEQLRQLTRKFRDLQCHVGWACLSRRDQDDDGAVVYGPALTPAFGTDMVGYVDIICHTRIEIIGKDEVFVGDFRRIGKFMGGDRYSLLPRTLVEPTFDRIVQYIDGTLTESTDPVLQEARERQKEAKARIKSEKPETADSEEE